MAALEEITEMGETTAALSTVVIAAMVMKTAATATMDLVVEQEEAAILKLEATGDVIRIALSNDAIK